MNAAPDTWLFHYQTLVAGLAALLGGAFVLAQAFIDGRREKRRAAKRHDERLTAFSAIVYAELTEFETSLKLLSSDLLDFQERLGADPSVIQDLNRLEIPSVSDYLFEDWRSQIGFDTRLIAALWMLRSDVKDFTDAVNAVQSRQPSLAPLPLFRDVSERTDTLIWRSRVADLAASVDNLLQTVAVVLTHVARSIPSDIVNAIQRGDVHEVALGGVSRSTEANR